MYRTDDPYGDFSRREFDRVRLGENRPCCSVCGERILESTAMRNDDGEIVCHDCFRNVWTEFDIDDFM